MKINDETDLCVAVELVRSCLIVHNLILEVEHAPEDTVEWEWVVEGLEDDAESINSAIEGFEWDEEVWGNFDPGSPREKRAQVQATLFRDLFGI